VLTLGPKAPVEVDGWHAERRWRITRTVGQLAFRRKRLAAMPRQPRGGSSVGPQSRLHRRRAVTLRFPACLSAPSPRLSHGAFHFRRAGNLATISCPWLTTTARWPSSGSRLDRIGAAHRSLCVWWRRGLVRSGTCQSNTGVNVISRREIPRRTCQQPGSGCDALIASQVLGPDPFVILTAGQSHGPRSGASVVRPVSHAA
jgi:hypothetical protein